MITKKDLMGYDFPSMEDYFEYIVESRANGQFTQMVELIDNMSNAQKNEFMVYLAYNNIEIKPYL